MWIGVATLIIGLMDNSTFSLSSENASHSCSSSIFEYEFKIGSADDIYVFEIEVLTA